VELDLVLKHFDLKKMGHNSGEYIHTIIEESIQLIKNNLSYQKEKEQR